MNEEAMSAWIEENFKSNLDVIEDLSYAQIKQMVLDREYVLIYACKSRKLTQNWIWSIDLYLSIDKSNKLDLPKKASKTKALRILYLS